MLRWPRVKLPERFRVLGSLWLISCSAHALLFIMVSLLSSAGGRQALVVSAARRNRDARIVLLPMMKTVRNTKFDSSSQKKTVVAKKKPKPVKKTVSPKPKKQLAKKTPVPKKPSTTVAQSKVAKPAPKKKAQTPIKKSAPTVAKIIKPADKKKTQTKKIEKLAQNKKAPKQVEGAENIIYVGRDDLRALQVQNVVADALQKNWRPPSGVAQETMCQVSFDVGKDGKACNVKMQDGSSVFIFDVAARTAIMQAHFSPSARGKQFTVAFKL